VKGNSEHRFGFTLIELLVVIAIIAVLAAILFPALTSAKDVARKSKCLNNMKQMGLAVRMYMDDNDGVFPLDSHWSPFDVWLKGLETYNRSKLLYRCPSDKSRNFDKPLPGWEGTDKIRKTSYGTNFYMAPVKPQEAGGLPLTKQTWSHGFTKLSDFANPSKTIYICETARDSTSDHVHPAWWRMPNSDGNFIPYGKEVATDFHNSGSNYVFVDGHAAWMKFGDTWKSDGSLDLWDVR
jgi:prepilin-type N-terminal cleavage/methylation domain-containing protein/prepilin-type processing-associated H-X9-DG protein